MQSIDLIVRKIFVIATLCLTAPAVMGSPAASLKIKPSICVLAAGENLCRETIDVEWQSQERIHACLYHSSGGDNAIDCWQESDSGSLATEIETATDNHFELRSSLDNTVLAQEILRVMREQQRLRNRRRNPWSFF